DKNFLSYGVEKKKQVNTGKRRFFLNDIEYDFVLNTGKKTLRLFEPETVKILMEMRKVTRAELKNSEEF
ncbi:MAG: hypothetical protein KJO50_07815, partial [Bacteroidia bacterium]|nr:hypothetical protein [Bacteroidia bacterium]